MQSTFKIPTLLGLGILVTGVALGVFLVTNNQFLGLQTKAGPSLVPKNITIANISDTSASVFWQTDQANTGFIQAGLSSLLDTSFKDDRDAQNPQPHQLHFVTLTKLKPSTTYYFKVTSGSLSYPSSPLSFQTSSTLAPSGTQPIIGTVIDSSLVPIPEALVVLDIPGAQKLATITKIAGNFILPLAELKTADLNTNFDISTLSGINLTVFNLEKTSHLTFPLASSSLPAITLGKDLNITPQADPSASPPIYDLNSDGIINALDRVEVINNLGKKMKNKKTDLNNDGVVDQKDVDLINLAIAKTSSP